MSNDSYGMMDDDVLGPNGRQTIAVELADAFRMARLKGRKKQLGLVLDDELRGVGEPDEPVLHGHLFVLDPQFRRHEAPQMGGHRRDRLRGE